jgi:integrase
MANIQRWHGGRWRARWRTPDGRDQSKVFDRKVDAERHLVDVQHRILTGSYVDDRLGRVTVKAYAEEWRARQVHRLSTRDLVELALRNRVYPTFGDRELGSIHPSEVQTWVTKLSQRLAPSTVEQTFRLLAGIYLDAVRDRYVVRTPCDGVKLPRRDKVEVVPPTVEQVQEIVTRLPERYRACGWVAAGAGLRMGEVLGLKVERVEFLRRQLRVIEQLVTPNKGAPRLGSPKTPSSVRTVPLGEVLLGQLSEHVGRFDPEPEHGLMFSTSEGNPVRKSTFDAAWARAVRDADMGKVRFHDLRHFYASALISAGCSIKAVQSALGHANASETLDTYSHLWPSDEDTTRCAIDAVWSNLRGHSGGTAEAEASS